jgi:hypothetical protein
MPPKGIGPSHWAVPYAQIRGGHEVMEITMAPPISASPRWLVHVLGESAEDIEAYTGSDLRRRCHQVRMPGPLLPFAYRSLTAASTFGPTFRAPRLPPWVRARAKPAMTRSLMMARSNSANPYEVFIGSPASCRLSAPIRLTLFPRTLAIARGGRLGTDERGTCCAAESIRLLTLLTRIVLVSGAKPTH